MVVSDKGRCTDNPTVGWEIARKWLIAIPKEPSRDCPSVREKG